MYFGLKKRTSVINGLAIKGLSIFINNIKELKVSPLLVYTAFTTERAGKFSHSAPEIFLKKK